MAHGARGSGHARDAAGLKYGESGDAWDWREWGKETVISGEREGERGKGDQESDCTVLEDFE
jgi:hypothetical protein